MVALVQVYDYARLLDDQFTKSGRRQFDSSLSGGLRLGVCKPVEPARANYARLLVKRGRAIDQSEVDYGDPDRIRQVGGGLQGDLDVRGGLPLPCHGTIILMIRFSIALFLTPFRERGFTVQE